MASTSAPGLLSSTATTGPPPVKGLKKVLTGRRRSSEVNSDGTRSSVDSATLEHTATHESTKSSPSRDGSIAAGASGMRKLIPGHNKRQRQKMREEEIKAAMDGEMRGRNTQAVPVSMPVTASTNRSNSSLLTDADYESPPPLVSRNSHTGYFTTSSPLITSRTVGEGHTRAESDGIISKSTGEGMVPTILAPDNPSRNSSPKLTSVPTLPLPNQSERANTLQVGGDEDRRRSFGGIRGKSPARKMRDIFAKSSRSPRSSPERSPHSPTRTGISASRDRSPHDQGGQLQIDMDRPGPAIPNGPKPKSESSGSTSRLPPSLQTEISLPRTPPGTTIAPATTVTPPTPVEKQREIFDADNDSAEKSQSDIASSPTTSGNSISHRRVRSASSATHSKSKLSTSTIPPLTPTIEELSSSLEEAGSSRNVSSGGGFFSSWVSAAQNAASTISSLTGQNNRNRSATTISDPNKGKSVDALEQISAESPLNDAARKKLAIETLGTGDLDFSHLGLDSAPNEKTPQSAHSVLANTRQETDLSRDEAQAKVEDLLAKRAVSAAYEKTADTTPVAEIADPIASLKQSQTFDAKSTVGTLTPPNGSIFEGESGPIKRSNSVRSKIANRRSRGSSIATGHSAIGTIVASSNATLVNPSNPSNAPKTTGFTPAPKTRNRAFHQQFRSVPEDDNLIEDYSCALQKEILLAGRIYISEGHICFSSNILGWVTTLIISFEEIVSIERENTAMIIPNAIAIQTLHARHTFRSLLSREATFDLIIGIWKVNHPASFQKSVNGKQLVAEQTENVVAEAIGTGEAASQGSDAENGESGSDDSDEDDDNSVQSVPESAASIAGSEFVDAKSVARKPSGVNGPTTLTQANTSTGDGVPALGAVGTASAPADFPGPVTHAPTECTDASTHYEKVIKDEVIPAPLGKVYSLLYGPESGVFVRKYLVDECKCTDLAFEDDKKGLGSDIKERQYSYIKPLGGSIGPKSTKCITVEALDFLDLEKSVSVTCSTQTPDVPSGNAFSTKTRYCLSWAPGNATRLQMNCTIEWTAKSWLKGPIERGANDGQQQYGDGLVKALKGALGRSRTATIGSKGVKTKKKRKGDKKAKSERSPEAAVTANNWGVLEPLRPTLGPLVDVIRPMAKMEVAVTIMFVMLLVLWFGGTGRKTGMGYPGSSFPQADKVAAYEELWSREESQLWDWLEARAGVSRVMHTQQDTGHQPHQANERQRQSVRQRQLTGKDLAARMRAEKWSQKEIQEAVRITREKLDDLQKVLDSQDP